jgi:hypothetical protein
MAGEPQRAGELTFRDSLAQGGARYNQQSRQVFQPTHAQTLAEPTPNVRLTGLKPGSRRGRYIDFAGEFDIPKTAAPLKKLGELFMPTAGLSKSPRPMGVTGLRDPRGRPLPP